MRQNANSRYRLTIQMQEASEMLSANSIDRSYTDARNIFDTYFRPSLPPIPIPSTDTSDSVITDISFRTVNVIFAGPFFAVVRTSQNTIKLFTGMFV